jgi:ribosomal protein L16 Arg81 hydroxylase
MDLSLKIDVVDDISAEDFKRFYLIPQKPLLIKGGIIKKTDAYTKWTIDFFKKEMGDLMVDIYDNNAVKNETTALTKGTFKMKFANFLDIIEKNEPTSLRMFLFNGFKYNPRLQNDFPKPPHLKGLPNLGFLFFGGKDTSVRMHFDIDNSNVLMTQIKGRKRVLLIAPEYSRYIYKIPFGSFTLVDFENIDCEKYPALKKVKGYDFVMNDGDSLFMPSGYWHYNTYLDGGYALSYRKMALDIRNRYNGLMNITLRLLMDKTLTALAKEKWTNYKINKAIKNASDS